MEGVRVVDKVGLIGSKEYAEVIPKDEALIWAGGVIKINKEGKMQQRNLAITNKSLFNLGPKGGFLTGMFRKTLKRAMNLEDVKAVTVSEIANSFVIHLPSEYDYSFSTPDKNEIVEYILIAQEKLGCPPLKLFFTPDVNLDKFVKKEGEKEDKWPVSKPQEMTLSGFRRLVETKKRELETSVKNTEVIITQNNQKVSEDSFEVVKLVGKGYFGRVYLVRKKDDGQMFALKVISKLDIIKKNFFENLKSERRIMQMIEHPFVMKLDYCFSSPSFVFFAMKFKPGGELFQHLRKAGHFPEDTARFYACQILLGLEYLHSIDVVYRDLKPENVLLDERGDCCLADFGISKVVEKDQKTRSFVGTPEYVAPEVVLQQGHDRRVDIWSFGVLLYEMLFGNPPFYHKNQNVMLSNILKSELTFPKSVASSPECQDLMTQVP